MERKNANIDDVIRTVETASAKELEELAGIREAVEDLKGDALLLLILSLAACRH